MVKLNNAYRHVEHKHIILVPLEKHTFTDKLKQHNQDTIYYLCELKNRKLDTVHKDTYTKKYIETRFELLNKPEQLRLDLMIGD
jgi:hypothetical protein